MKEYKIGEKFEYDGKILKCVKDVKGGTIADCADCAFGKESDCNNMNCIDFNRKDRIDVHFEEVKISKIREKKC